RKERALRRSYAEIASKAPPSSGGGGGARMPDHTVRLAADFVAKPPTADVTGPVPAVVPPMVAPFWLAPPTPDVTRPPPAEAPRPVARAGAGPGDSRRRVPGRAGVRGGGGGARVRRRGGGGAGRGGFFCAGPAGAWGGVAAPRRAAARAPRVRARCARRARGR